MKMSDGKDRNETILVFMDESGTSSMKHYRANSLGRYFNLAALLCYQSDYTNHIVPKFEEWKQRTFPEIYESGQRIYMHASDLMHGKYEYKGMAESRRREIYAGLIDLLTSFRIKLITICIDKDALRECVPNFEGADWEVAYETALALHLERYVIFLEKHARKHGRKFTLKITIESREPKQNRDVDKIYARLRKHGHKLWRSVTPRQVDQVVPQRDLRFMRKHDWIHGLELVDQVANPLLNLTRAAYDRLGSDLRWQEQIVREKLGSRIDSVSGVQKGHGLKLYPSK